MRNEAKTQEDKKVSQMLEKVKNRLLIFSGKGGVGKSTVAAKSFNDIVEKIIKQGK